MGPKHTKFYLWLAGLVPARLCYFCFVRVMVHATTGKHSDTVVPELRGMEALKRFGNDKGFKGEN